MAQEIRSEEIVLNENEIVCLLEIPLESDPPTGTLKVTPLNF